MARLIRRPPAASATAPATSDAPASALATDAGIAARALFTMDSATWNATTLLAFVATHGRTPAALAALASAHDVEAATRGGKVASAVRVGDFYRTSE